MPVYAYCEPEEQRCQHGADAPIVFVFVERDLAMDLGIAELVTMPDFTFEEETVRTESVVARVEVRSNISASTRHLCPYSTERREAAPHWGKR